MARTILTGLCMLLISSAAMALEITSVAPARAVPETQVILTGGLFSEQSRIYLGEQYVPALRLLPRQMIFAVPPLPPGTYSLTVQDETDAAVQAFNFEVLAPRPRIAGIEPDNLDVCADEAGRVVRVKGNGFRTETLLMLDGNAVSARVIDPGTMEFRIPELPAGVYGVEARNPDGTASLPHSLWVNNVPEIEGVDRGDDFVNHYEAIIRGKNFFFNSILMVTETDNSAGGTGTRQRAFYAHRSNSPLAPGTLPVQGEQLRYADCQTLVYLRFPSTPQNKSLIFQVINPDGKKTSPYTVSLP